MTDRIGDGRSIRIVQNKDDSLTAYVPARWAGLFTDMLREGQTGVYEAEPERFDDYTDWIVEARR
tara:strand:+ start:463 stop:657 length:195 start_codon:yes stop_codon:yes gene_type:complete